jgi:hypothetical protein
LEAETANFISAVPQVRLESRPKVILELSWAWKRSEDLWFVGQGRIQEGSRVDGDTFDNYGLVVIGEVGVDLG